MRLLPLLLLLTLTLPAFSQSQAGSAVPTQAPVGSLDHVRILVHDINAARSGFRDRLGFEPGAPQPVVFSEGSVHDVMWLADRTYLEPIAVEDREKLSKERPWIVEFLDHYQGAQSVGFSISSAQEFSDQLRSRGIDAPVTTLIPKPGARPFHHVTPKLPNIAPGAIFFTEHGPRTTPPHEFAHPNTAQRILAVWIVVRDLEKASADLSGLGFRPVRSLNSEALGAEGREFASDRGSIILMHPKGNGPASDFARERTEGVMGVTLEVTDLAKARELIEKNTNGKLSTYEGFYGSSILVPAEEANGAWIEMTEEQQRPEWCRALPRPEYKSLKRVPVSDSWFEVYEVEPAVFAIYEPRQSEETISYLIVGEKRAALFDTGMGIGNLKQVTSELTRLPIVVLNSHTHNDHVGDNWRFDDVDGMDTDFTRQNARGSREAAQEEIGPGQLCGELPKGFRREDYVTRPWKITATIHDGDRVDLGGRSLEVIATPGHTPDAITLFDRAHGLLFTGDTYYPAPIWLFRPETDLDAYSKSIRRLAALAPQVKTVLGAHNVPVAPPSVLGQLVTAFDAVRSGKVEPKPDSPGKVIYEANGIRFLMRSK